VNSIAYCLKRKKNITKENDITKALHNSYNITYRSLDEIINIKSDISISVPYQN